MKYNKLPLLEEVGLELFRTIVFDAVKNNLANAIVEFIGREREGMSQTCTLYTYSVLSNCPFTFFHDLGSIIIDPDSEKISQRQSRFNRMPTYTSSYIRIHRINSSSSSAAGANEKESSDDPQFNLTGGHGSKYQQGISFVYFLVLINLIITTCINNFVKASDDYGGAEVQESEQDIAAQEAAWAQQRGESLPSKRFGLSQPQHIHT